MIKEKQTDSRRNCTDVVVTPIGGVSLNHAHGDRSLVHCREVVPLSRKHTKTIQLVWPSTKVIHF